MEILYIVLGILIGITIYKIFDNKRRVVGVIEVDHNSGLCRVRITSADLADIRSRKAMFKIEHNAMISREEQ